MLVFILIVLAFWFGILGPIVEFIGMVIGGIASALAAIFGLLFGGE